MGDRTITYYPCPKCGKEMEEYDAPTCLMFVAVCEHCGWKDDRNYYEDENGVLNLCTEKEFKRIK